MMKSKIEQLQHSILNEIISTVNNSMSTENKLKIVRNSINRYERQLNNLKIDETLEKLAESGVEKND